MNDEEWQSWEEARLAARLIGASMRDPAIMDELMLAGVSDVDFTSQVLKDVWGICAPLYRQHKRLDPALVEESLTIFYDQQKAIEVMRVITGARGVTKVDEVPTLLTHMRQRAGVRRLSMLAKDLLAATAKPRADLTSIIRGMRIGLEDIASTSSVLSGASAQDLAKIAIEQLSGQRRTLQTVPLGIPDIDQALGGGAPRGWTTLVYAPSGTGKSTYGYHMILAAARSGHPGVLFSYEVDREECAQFLTEILAGFRYPRGANSGGREQMAALTAAAAELADLPIWIEDDPMNVEEMQATLRAHKRAHPLEWFMVDYVQEIEHSTKNSRDDLNHAHVSRSLRKFTKVEKLAGVLLSQVSTSGDSGGARGAAAAKPTSESSAGSKQYGKDAGTVLILDRKKDEQDSKKRNVSSVRLAKNKLLGALAQTWMRWHPDSNRLTPCTKDGEDVIQVPIADDDSDDPFTSEAA